MKDTYRLKNKTKCIIFCIYFRAGQLKAHLSKKHMNYKEDVIITRTGRYNALQFHFRQGTGFVTLTDPEGQVIGGDSQSGMTQIILQVYNNHTSVFNYW